MRSYNILRMSKWKRVFVVFLVGWTLYIAILLFTISRPYTRYGLNTVLSFFKGDQYADQHPDEHGCNPPLLRLDHPEIQALSFHDVPVVCDSEPNWISVRNGSFEIKEYALNRYGPISCEITPIIRGDDDFTWHHGPTTKIRDGEKVTNDAFDVKCSGNSSKTYENSHLTISYQEKVHNDNKANDLPKSALGLNIVVIGLDSLSRLQWLRKLPKSHDFLTNNLSALHFKHINVLGDGTPAAIFPLFTGLLESELPVATKLLPGAVTLDNFPFLWNDLARYGYITLFSEDFSTASTFTYRLRGFNKQPTHHYARHYYLYTEKKYDYAQCTGASPKFRVAMDYISDFFNMYRNRMKMVYSFLGSYTHDRTMIRYTHADSELLGFLKRFQDDGHLDTTLLIIMSDHGSRFSEIRSTEQGKLEERLPYLSIVLPSWFSKVHPKAFDNMKYNTDRLVTYADVYETLKNVVEFEGTGAGNISHRGISLFQTIPAKRSCRNAGIADHWCSCLSWSSVSLNDPIIAVLSTSIINYINNLLTGVRDLCSRLDVASILHVDKFMSGGGLRKFSESIRDSKGFDLAVLDDNTKATFEVFQVKFTTTPGDGLFMFTLHHMLDDEQYVISREEISRLNTYGDSAACLEHKRTLKIFCHCKESG